MKPRLISLLLTLLILSVVTLQNSVACDLTSEELFDRLDALPWEDYTHTHDTTNMPNHSGASGTHTHEGMVKEIRIGTCVASEHKTTELSRFHEVVEPDPPPPVIEDYKKPSVVVCIAGPCLEKRPIQVLGPLDIHGNLPPVPEEGEPELFYPTVKIDDKIYWDSTRKPYQISEEVKNAETPPDGYRLQEIKGQLFLVPYEDTLKHPLVDRFEDPPPQDTLIIYLRVNVIGGRDYLEPTPFHVHPVDGSDGSDDPVPPAVDAPENPQSASLPDPPSAQAGDPPGTQAGNQSGTQEGLEIQEEEGETFASLDGQFYQVTSTPATPLLVTEYMVATWGDGQGKLPQWIEIYNPNALAVNVVGYELAYVFKKQTHTIELGHFLIPPEGAMILATHTPRRRYRYEGITDSQVYNLDIAFNALTQGWSLKDALGTVISETGKHFGQPADPIKPGRVGLSRVSYNVYVSEPSKTPYFFGFRKDVSSPGFYEPKVPRSPALLRQRMTTTWASFKQSK